MITLSTILAVIVTNMFFRGVRINRAPAWLRKVSIFWKKIILNVDDYILQILIT